MTATVDVNSYEFKERLAILLENNPDMHPAHAFNKAKKEIAQRNKNDRDKLMGLT